MLQLIATGNLTRDPELRQTNGGKSVCNFTIAANHEFKGVDGNRPTYIDVVVWEKRAIALASLLKKGTRVFVKGELEAYAYTDKSEVKHEKHRIILGDLEILSLRTNENGGKE